MVVQFEQSHRTWSLFFISKRSPWGNDLTGDIVQMLETLSSCCYQSLEFLDLSSNQLSGKLPHSLGQLSRLSHLDLSSNSLSGLVPATMGNLSNLDTLNLEGNMMNGKIPESIGQLTKLYDLNLLKNNWEGTMTNIHFQFSIISQTYSFSLYHLKGTHLPWKWHKIGFHLLSICIKLKFVIVKLALHFLTGWETKCPWRM